MTAPWNEPGLTPQVRALRKESALRAAFDAYLAWWRTPGLLDDKEPPVADFLDNVYARGELKRAAQHVANLTSLTHIEGS